MYSAFLYPEKLCFLIFYRLDAVCKSHKAVAQMHVLYSDVLELNCKIVVREIPESCDAVAYQLVGDLLSVSLRYAQYSNCRRVLLAEFFQLIGVFNGQGTHKYTCQIGVAVKDTYKFAASGLKIYMSSDSSAKIACADDYRFEIFVNTEDLAYLVIEILNVVAVTLLTETAEAVEILSDLRCGELHQLRKFTGRYALDSELHQFSEKAVVPRHTVYYRRRDRSVL